MRPGGAHHHGLWLAGLVLVGVDGLWVARRLDATRIASPARGARDGHGSVGTLGTYLSPARLVSDLDREPVVVIYLVSRPPRPLSLGIPPLHRNFTTFLRPLFSLPLTILLAFGPRVLPRTSTPTFSPSNLETTLDPPCSVSFSSCYGDNRPDRTPGLVLSLPDPFVRPSGPHHHEPPGLSTLFTFGLDPVGPWK